MRPSSTVDWRSVPVRTGTLAVPGARLYFEVRGSGPTLLLIPTGNGDCTPYAPLAALLSDRHQVVTYDRRGFSRSAIEGPVDSGRRFADDVDDARRLIAHVGGGPADVFGGSSGAIVALATLTRCPESVRVVVAHEPPLVSVMPDADHWYAFYQEVYDIYRREGPKAAAAAFRAGMGMTITTRMPPETALPPAELDELLERLRRNHLFWLEHELRGYPATELDLAALVAAGDRMVLAGGVDSREAFPYRPNEVLAQRTGSEIVHFPGGHVGYVTHPFAFADALAELLASR
ncbi:alpha/beta hydrolase [Solwaraspora sp. WMMD406]|uniref:alpha/beta fold hydrolase n=1 Tax=Solwaraspora sp. WMMD406 TaxID=3016095 RepID=UPI002416A8AB|nr:alpha/beta hydrolase [Solwaraspora sp. WMMD406]MDG4766894.1 alpha/beta hydrolase [Solwaraspora sp. WMMD406]